MNKKSLLTTLLAVVLAAPAAQAQSPQNFSCGPIKKFFKTKRQKRKEDAAKRQAPSKDEMKYAELTEGAKISRGLVTTILKDDQLFFELPDSIFGKSLLISNRISTTSNTTDFVAGQMINNPFMIRLTKTDDRVFMHIIQTEDFVEPGDPISPSFHRNFRDPILRAFKIGAKNGNNVVIQVTPLFDGSESTLNPIKKNGRVQGAPIPGGSYFTAVKSFPKNVEIKNQLSYRSGDNPYTIEVHRSLVLLPDHPMRMRLQDNRVGYFSSSRNRYTTNKDKIESFEIIHRWRLEPKDSAAYARGELVEPVKPIVYYVDTVFPKKWKEAVKLGILDWNKAFNVAGFKNAVIVKEYPSKEEDPNFDPDDMRYSCVKYATTGIANAMGPSYVDPRSGEILNADVIWYHNIITLLHNWRFTQTAAVDPRVRTLTFPDSIMAQSMRYVASHEIGHTLGLMHNMGASYSYPVEKLRDPAFTQKYGTTPSIMDYARNNFVAQPGDFEKGVNLVPPLLGVYDIYAINWGYRLIPEAKTYREEKKVLNKWIEEKKNDQMYVFGAQQINTLDPTAQTEDLGNDEIVAGNYGIKNLKYIMQHYEQWLYQPGDRTDDLESAHREIITQFMRYISHVSPYVGGRIYHENRQGDGMMPVTYIPKEKQKAAIKWVVKELRDIPNWLLTQETMQKYDKSGSFFGSVGLMTLVPNALSDLMAPWRMRGVIDGYNAKESTGYSFDNYVNDVLHAIFEKSYAGKKLTNQDKQIEDTGLLLLCSFTSPKSDTGKKARKKLSQDIDIADSLFINAPENRVPCCALGLSHNEATADHNFFRANLMPAMPAGYQIMPTLLNAVQEIRQLYRRRAQTTRDRSTREYYKYWEMKLKEMFDK